MAEKGGFGQFERAFEQKRTEKSELDLKTPEKQTEILSAIYPELDDNFILEILAELGDLRKEDGEELFLVCPKISSLAQKSEIEDPFGKGFADLLLQGFKRLSIIHPISTANDVRGRSAIEGIKEGEVLLAKKSLSVLQDLEEKTRGDFLIFPFQCGILFNDQYSSRETREEIDKSDVALWPSTPWEVAHFLALHPSFFESQERSTVVSCPGLTYPEAPAARAFFELDYVNNSEKRIDFCVNTYPRASETTGFIRLR